MRRRTEASASHPAKQQDERVPPRALAGIAAGRTLFPTTKRSGRGGSVPVRHLPPDTRAGSLLKSVGHPTNTRRRTPWTSRPSSTPSGTRSPSGWWCGAAEALGIALLMGADHGAGARGRSRHSVKVMALAEGIPPVRTGGIPQNVWEFLHLRPIEAEALESAQRRWGTLADGAHARFAPRSVPVRKEFHQRLHAPSGPGGVVDPASTLGLVRYLDEIEDRPPQGVMAVHEE